MNQDNPKLSLCGRAMNRLIFTKSLIGFQGERILSVTMFVVSILWLSSAIQSAEIKKSIYSAAFGLFSIIWFIKSGCSELIEKKKIKQKLNSEPVE